MVKGIIQWKKAYTDKDGLTHIPIKLKGKKKFKCDDCGKKVREVFTINPCELLLKRELCRECYCNTPESLENLLSFTVKDDFLDNLGEKYELDEADKMKGDVFIYVCNKCGESLDVEIDSEISKVPFEGIWNCKCGNVIKIKWNGKELEYI